MFAHLQGIMGESECSYAQYLPLRTLRSAEQGNTFYNSNGSLQNRTQRCPTMRWSSFRGFRGWEASMLRNGTGGLEKHWEESSIWNSRCGTRSTLSMEFKLTRVKQRSWWEAESMWSGEGTHPVRPEWKVLWGSCGRPSLKEDGAKL